MQLTYCLVAAVAADRLWIPLSVGWLLTSVFLPLWTKVFLCFFGLVFDIYHAFLFLVSCCGLLLMVFESMSFLNNAHVHPSTLPMEIMLPDKILKSVWQSFANTMAEHLLYHLLPTLWCWQLPHSANMTSHVNTLTLIMIINNLLAFRCLLYGFPSLGLQFSTMHSSIDAFPWPSTMSTGDTGMAASYGSQGGLSLHLPTAQMGILIHVSNFMHHFSPF